MYSLRKTRKLASSRRQIQIKTVRDNVLILANNMHVVALECSSINFELMSEEEQDNIIDNFQAFLNSMNTDIQILVRIRQIDIKKYLSDFKINSQNDTNKVYKNQAAKYVEFVSNLTSSSKILTRKFYLLIKEAPSSSEFSEIKEKLNIKAELLSNGMSRLGIRTQLLDNLEILDLFYSFYSPTKAKIQPLKNRTIKLVSKAII